MLPTVSPEAMNAHLAEISRSIAPGAHAVLRRENDPPDHFLILLILDGAGWHDAAALVVPDNLSLLTLPPYSPELNPVENIWQYLRANWFAISVLDSYDAIVDACCAAWNRFANEPNTVTSITSRAWAQVN